MYAGVHNICAPFTLSHSILAMKKHIFDIYNSQRKDGSYRTRTRSEPSGVPYFLSSTQIMGNSEKMRII
jgi:hypothetical protein